MYENDDSPINEDIAEEPANETISMDTSYEDTTIIEYDRNEFTDDGELNELQIGER